MKFFFASTLLLSTLAIFAHADENAAVFYDNGFVDITDATQCIAFTKQDSTVEMIQFGLNVQCHTFASNDCSGTPIDESPLSFDAGKDIKQEEFGQAFPNGSIKCE